MLRYLCLAFHIQNLQRFNEIEFRYSPQSSSLSLPMSSIRRLPGDAVPGDTAITASTLSVIEK